MLDIICKICNFSILFFYSQINSLYCIFAYLFGYTGDIFFNYYNIEYLQIKFTGDKFEKIDKTTKSVLFNHVSYADFIIDNYILQCKGCYLSNHYLFLIIPFTCIYAIITRQIYLFNRNTYNTQIGECIVDTVCNKWNRILLFYPEGRRNKTGKIIPLKFGIIKHLYLQKLPCQIINISNKEKVINENRLSVNYGVVCNVVITEQIDPVNFDTLDDFIEKISTMWIQNFQ